MTAFKPLLSASVADVTKLRYPLLASPKLDGVRAIVLNGVLVSRNLKPIPNKHVQAMFGRKELEGFDGELIMGDPTDPAAFRNTSSAVMSHDGEPNVTFHAFDLVGINDVFDKRLDALRARAKKLKNVVVVPHTRIAEQLLETLEQEWLEAGFEGVMLRDPQGLYKHGRSTFKEHGLMKLKRFEDAEATIVGFEEQMHNTNEAKTNALGHKERSTKKAGMVGKGTLGALKVKGLNGTYKGVEFNIGSGFDDAQRAHIWKEQHAWQGVIVKFKYFPSGSKDAPRFPVYLGVRHENDR